MRFVCVLFERVWNLKVYKWKIAPGFPKTHYCSGSSRPWMTFAIKKTIFGFLVMVCDRVCDEDKFLYENFGLGKPRFHATAT